MCTHTHTHADTRLWMTQTHAQSDISTIFLSVNFKTSILANALTKHSSTDTIFHWQSDRTGQRTLPGNLKVPAGTIPPGEPSTTTVLFVSTAAHPICVYNMNTLGWCCPCSGEESQAQYVLLQAGVATVSGEGWTGGLGPRCYSLQGGGFSFAGEPVGYCRLATQ